MLMADGICHMAHEIMQQIYIQPVQYQSARTWQLFQ